MKNKTRDFLLTIVFWTGIVSLSSCGLKPNPQLNEGSSVQDEKSQPLQTAVSVNPGFESDMLQTIESYLGVRYRWGGRTRRGMDCSGFVSTVYKETLNVDLPRRVRDMYAKGKRVARENLQFGDLVFFRKIEHAGVSHVGIFLGEARFAHASTSAGVIVSTLTESYYQRRYAGARRLFSPMSKAP